MNINGKEGGEKLGAKKKKERQKKGSFGKKDFFSEDHADQPKAGDDGGKSVDQEHFGEFKQFGGGGGPG